MLKPDATLYASGNKAEMVDLCFQKPCLVSTRLRWNVMNGRGSRSRTWMTGQSREFGRYDDPKWQGLPTLGIGVKFASFLMDGMLADCTKKVKS